MAPTEIRVAIVEDIQEIRRGLAMLMGGSPGLVCVGEFSDGVEALNNIPELHPDVVLMDINMPRMNGIDCIIKLKAKLPSLQIMMLTVFEDDDKIFQSIVAGANGYLLKKTSPANLLEAIQELYNGGSPMSSQIARKVITAFRQTNDSHAETENLTAREQEILVYLAKGFRYKEIADTLFISTETVRTHLHHIYEKLHVRSRTEAVLRFLKK